MTTGLPARRLPPLALLLSLVAMALAGGMVILTATQVARLVLGAEASALTDPLTSLSNRRHATVFLDAAFAACERGMGTPGLLVAAADRAPYRDKEAGRDRVAVWKHVERASRLRPKPFTQEDLSARLEEPLATAAAAEENHA